MKTSNELLKTMLDGLEKKAKERNDKEALENIKRIKSQSKAWSE